MTFCLLALGASSVTVVGSLDRAPFSDHHYLVLPDNESLPAKIKKTLSTGKDLRVVDVEWVKQTLIIANRVSREDCF